MASFKEMEMAEALSKNSDIEIKKSFFGLSQTAVYSPTQSRINFSVAEYAPQEGERVERLLKMPLKKMAEEAEANGTPAATPVGHFRLEKGISTDGQFVALQLLRYNDFSYTDASGLLVFEGADAKTAAKIWTAR